MTRSQKTCQCTICLIAIAHVGGGGQPKSFTKPFERGRPSLPGPKQLLTPKPMTVCTRCLQTVGPGINHPKHCTIKDRRQNIQDLVEQDPRGAEMAASFKRKDDRK